MQSLLALIGQHKQIIGTELTKHYFVMTRDWYGLHSATQTMLSKSKLHNSQTKAETLHSKGREIGVSSVDAL